MALQYGKGEANVNFEVMPVPSAVKEGDGWSTVDTSMLYIPATSSIGQLNRILKYMCMGDGNKLSVN